MWPSSAAHLRRKTLYPTFVSCHFSGVKLLADNHVLLDPPTAPGLDGREPTQPRGAATNESASY